MSQPTEMWVTNAGGTNGHYAPVVRTGDTFKDTRTGEQVFVPNPPPKPAVPAGQQ